MQLWRAMQEWCAHLSRWSNSPLKDLDVREITDLGVQYNALGVQLERELPPSPVPTDLKLRAKAAGSWGLVAKSLQNPKLRDRHLAELCAELGLADLSAATLGDVLDANGLAHSGKQQQRTTAGKRHLSAAEQS